MTKIKDKINMYRLRTVSANLNTFDILAEKDDFIEVSEWHNDGGYDITINKKRFSLTEGELKAINHLVQVLDIADDDDFKKE